MRSFIVAAITLVLCSLFSAAAAKPDKGLSAAFETYLQNRVHSEVVIAKRELNHEEMCGVLYRAVERFRSEVKRNGRDLEKHLTYESLVHLRMIERDCKPHKTVKPKRFKEGEEPAIVEIGGTGGIRDLDDPVDDSLEAEALDDYMKWHPNEHEPKNAEEAADLAILKWEVSKRGRELKAQLLKAEEDAGTARFNLEGATDNNREERKQKLAEINETVDQLKDQIAEECMKARDEAVAKWARDNVTAGTEDDMTPKTTSGETRRYTDGEGNKVAEYDNGARNVTYPDGREVTVEPDGTRITEHPDGHVIRENPDGSIECLKDHPDGVLRIIVQKNGETDYFLNGKLVAHYWPEWFPNQLVRHVDFIDRQTGLTPIERLSPMQKFRLWLRKKRAEESHVVDWNDRKAVAQYYLNQLAEFQRTHPGVFDDETFEEFVARREFELRHTQRLERGRIPTEDDRRENYRQILTEWEEAHPDETLTLTDLIAKRKLEEKLQNGTIGVKEIPLGLDVERLKLEIQAYLDWLEWHPNPTQDEERERRQHAARLRLALKAQRDLYEGTYERLGGEETLRKIVGDKRFGAMKVASETLPADIPDKASGGSIDPLDPDWPGRKPNTVRAEFSSLNGMTRVNGALLPDANATTLTIIGVDGNEYAPGQDLARINNSGEDILVFVSPTVELAAILLRSNAGTVVLEATLPAPVGQAAISPLDGMVDIRNGQLGETLRVPESVTEINRPVQAHEVQIGQGLTPGSNPAAGTVAVREGEIAIYAENVEAPTLGDVECTVHDQNGQNISKTLPAWSYDIQPQPVTAVNTWAPIYFTVAGLDPDEKLRVAFSPPDGITVKPRKTKVNAGEFALTNQIAEYRTPYVGPQPIGATVERLE